MVQKLKIVSDGTAQGTKVYAGNTQLTGIIRLELEPVEAGEPVVAKLTFDSVELDMVADLAPDAEPKPAAAPNLLQRIAGLFRSSIPAPKVGQVWISLNSWKCIHVAEVTDWHTGSIFWDVHSELDDGYWGFKPLEVMGKNFNPLPDSYCGISTWRRMIREERRVLLGSPEYVEAYRAKHGRNTNPPPWFSKPTYDPVIRVDARTDQSKLAEAVKRATGDLRQLVS